MNSFVFDDRWEEIKGQLKQRYAQLTDDDLLFAEGKGEEVLHRIRERLSLAPDALQEILTGLSTALSAKGQTAKKRGVKQATRSATDVVAGSVAEAQQRTRTLYEDGEEYVRQNPQRAVLMAAGAGFIVALMLRP